jgi:DtxR family transcriptional regulator, Mn-dependent transcriptional regulator
MAKAPSIKLSESLEDYLEAILNLSDESGITRAKDVAETLGVAKSSVTGALRLLASKGLVNYRPYEYITLTKKGQAEAARVAGKHGVLKCFFTDVMGVEADAAQEAACRAEHALGPVIMNRLVEFVDFVMQPGEGGVSAAGRFRDTCAKHHESVHQKGNK